MRHSTQLFPEFTVGMDLGDTTARVVIVDVNGAEVERKSVKMSRAEVGAFLGDFPRARVVLETGTQSPWITWLAQECGHEVVVANTRHASRSFKKTDDLDAEALARKGRVDPQELHPIEHRSREAFLDRSRLKIREGLVACRTHLINGARSHVKEFGYRIPSSSTHAFREHLLEDLPEEIALPLRPLCEVVSALNKCIAKYDRDIEALCEKRYPDTKKLRQVSGVGPITALALLLSIQDPGRFKKSRDVGAYFGLAPRVQQSGDWNPQLGISKAGNSMVRKLLVGSAHYIMGPFGDDCSLQRFGRNLARRGGKAAKKKAAVAVARKLAALLHRLWVSDEPYDPLRAVVKKRGQMVTSSR